MVVKSFVAHRSSVNDSYIWIIFMRLDDIIVIPTKVIVYFYYFCFQAEQIERGKSSLNRA